MNTCRALLALAALVVVLGTEYLPTTTAVIVQFVLAYNLGFGALGEPRLRLMINPVPMLHVRSGHIPHVRGSVV